MGKMKAPVPHHAGLTDKLMGFEDIVAPMDAVAAKRDRPKVCRKKPLQISN